MKELTAEKLQEWRDHGFRYIAILEKEEDAATGASCMYVAPTHTEGKDTVSLAEAELMRSGTDKLMVGYEPQTFHANVDGFTFCFTEESGKGPERQYILSAKGRPEIRPFHMRPENNTWVIVEREQVPPEILALQIAIGSVLTENQQP